MVHRGDSVAQVDLCYHPTVWRNMCAECGTYLKEKETCSASVAMEHTIPDLLISEKDAQSLGREDELRLLKSRQLVLLVDLDQTLIHTTNDNIPNNLKDVYHFQLPFGWPQDVRWYHTKFRPRTKEFLESMSKLFELHICTFGVRSYAHTIARFLDPNGKYFQQRILSRDECFHPTLKTSNLKALFPCGDSMVCIIDDRQDVWKNALNLVHVKPYRFFDGTADINAPPEADKTVADGTENCTVNVSRRKAKIVKVQKSDANGTRQKEAKLESGDENLKTKSKDENELQPSICDGAKDIPQKNSENGLKNDFEKDVSESNTGDPVDAPPSETTSTPDAPPSETTSMPDAPPSETTSTPVNDADCADKAPEEPSVSKSSSSSKLVSEQTEEDCKEVLEFIEWEDLDDYLIYLADILQRIHSAFYEMYDEMKQNASAPTPDLKKIVPYVRKKVLQGARILFSGVFPTNQAPETARAFQAAIGLGATVHMTFVPPDAASKDAGGASKDAGGATTHLVAAKLGTEKMRLVSKFKEVKIVSPEWLWACADRWEWVDERLYPLNEDTSKSFLDQGSPNPNTGQTSRADRGKVRADAEVIAKAESDLDSVNLGMSSSAFSDMLHDVEDDLNDSDDEIENENEGEKKASGEGAGSFSKEEENGSESESQLEEQMLRDRVLGKRKWEDEDDSSEEESLCGDLPKGWEMEEERRKRPRLDDADLDEELLNDETWNESTEDEDVLNSTSVDNSDSEKSFSSVNEMADILERDYLS